MSNRQYNQLFPVRIGQALINLVFSARYLVEGDSMLPTLASKQYVLVVGQKFSWNQILRGDIVVFRHPILAGRVYTKRIIGLPDENIRLQKNLVCVNSSPLQETYLSKQPHVPSPLMGEGQDGDDYPPHLSPLPPGGRNSGYQEEYDREWWLGTDEYFVMSDNRDEGQDDSRAFGPVNRQLITGRVWFRYWPLNSWGPIPRQSRKPR